MDLTALRPDQLLKWSPAKRQMTINGPKMVCEAVATKAFWDAWRQNKEAMKAAGISPKKIGEVWAVFWYRPLDAEQLAKQAEAITQSRAASADVELPRPAGLDYLPFQKAGIAYASNRNAILIADEMGLGKTIQAIGIANLTKAKRILVICPASLKINWELELTKWLVEPHTIGIVRPGKPFPATDVVIINYDLLKKYRAELRASTWDLLIGDEAHYLKNSKAQRTAEVVGSSSKAKDKISAIPATRRVLLTGTPIVNRPIELWSLIHYLNPSVFKNFFGYAKRYCNGHNNGYGWDFSGSSNLPELQSLLRESVMIRRKKNEVLTDLPAKQRQIIALEPDSSGRAAIAAEQKAMARHEQETASLLVAVELAKASEDPGVFEAAVAKLRDHGQAVFTEIARLRKETALAKVDSIIEHIADCEKVVVMAHHREVVDRIRQAFPTTSVVLTGETLPEARQAAVVKFQTDPSCNIFIGTIRAAGVGLTLTAASHVVFAELDWTPGAMSQAEDRCHRIGQRSSVLVQHLVLDGSIDARLSSVLISKQKVADSALDKAGAPVAVVEAEPEIDLDDLMQKSTEVATKSASRAKIAEEALKITSLQIGAIHACLRILAGFDADHAQIQNEIGFNKLDGSIGHSLAERESLTPKQAALGLRIARKYHRQLPATLLAQAKGE